MAPNQPHQLYWHTIIPLKFKLYDGIGAYLQMGNQLDFDIGPHGKFLDSYTRAALDQGHQLIPFNNNRVDDHRQAMRLHTGLGSSKKVSYTVFIAAKLAMSVKKTPTRTTFFRLDPASSSTAERFLKHWACMNMIRPLCATMMGDPPIAYGSVRDSPFYHCLCLGIDWDLSRAVDHAIANYGL